MNIRSTRQKIIAWVLLGFPLVFLVVMFTLTVSGGTASVVEAKSQLLETQLEDFAQNNILFYDPSDCVGGGTSSGICGSNTKEKLWTALRQHFDEIHTAAALGNILHEGGLNPLRWEYRVVSRNPPAFTSPVDDWNKLYDGTYIKRCYNEEWDYCIGVGDFAITWYLDEYLHYIEENEPDLFDYFKDPKYTYIEGDSLIDELGESIYDRLIALEVKYFIEEWLNPDTKKEFENYTDVTGAARYYSRAIMACELCKTESVMSARAASAEEMYAELKGFSCTPSASSSSTKSNSASSSSVSGSDITWIGDSYSENSTNKATIETKYSGIYYDGKSGRMFANDSPTYGSSGLNILKNDIKEDLRNYLVFALGTNTDAGSKDAMANNIDDLVDTVKKYNSSTKIILVSPITNNDSARSTYDAYHEAMQEAVEKYDNVILADWYDFAKDHLNEYFDDHSTGSYTSNSTHPNAKGYEKWIGVITDALSSVGNNGCGGDANPTVTVDGNEYMFPLSGASKDNYLHGIDETSVLSPMPCSNYSVGACHHDYVALDMGLRKQKVDGQEKTSADYPDLSYDDYYYYSDGVKVLAFVEGEVTYAGYYSNGVPDGYGDKCGQLMYRGVDGNEYWLGHLAYNDSISAGDTFKLGEVIGEVGPPPCAQGTQSHVHIHISPDSSNNTKLYDIINATYEALPETRSASSSSANCGNVCKNNGPTGTESTKPIGPIHDPSVDIACDPRTKDLGVRDDAYYNYERYSIRLCSIPNIKMKGTQGDDGDDGYVHVNSRVSGAFYSLSEEHKKKCGNYLEAVDDYRTNEEQTYYYNCYITGSCNGGNLAAVPGSPYSNHQQGLAIDFDTSTYCSSDSSVASGPGGLLNSSFLAQFGLEDGRNFSQFENWHVQAAEQ